MQIRLWDFPALIVHWMPSAGKKLIVPIGTKGFFNLHIMQVPSLLLVHCFYTWKVSYSLSGFVLAVLCCHLTEAHARLELLHCFHTLTMLFTQNMPNLSENRPKKGVIHNQQKCYSFNGGLKVTMWLHIIILQVLENSLNSTIICILYYCANTGF